MRKTLPLNKIMMAGIETEYAKIAMAMKAKELGWEWEKPKVI